MVAGAIIFLPENQNKYEPLIFGFYSFFLMLYYLLKKPRERSFGGAEPETTKLSLKFTPVRTLQLNLGNFNVLKKPQCFNSMEILILISSYEEGDARGENIDFEKATGFNRNINTYLQIGF